MRSWRDGNKKNNIKSVSVSHLLQNSAVWLEFLLLTDHLPCAEAVSQRISGGNVLKHFCQGVNSRALHSHQLIFTANGSVRPWWVASNCACLETISPLHVPCSFVREPVDHWQTLDADIHLCLCERFLCQRWIKPVEQNCSTEETFFKGLKSAENTHSRQLTDRKDFKSQIMSSFWKTCLVWLGLEILLNQSTSCQNEGKHLLCIYTLNSAFSKTIITGSHFYNMWP